MQMAITCKNRDCCELMPLPDAIRPHPETASWPDVYPGFFPFLCPACGHAYVYSMGDAVDVEPAKINRGKDGSPRKVRNVVRIIVPCWSEMCSKRPHFHPTGPVYNNTIQRGYVQINTLMPFDLNLPKFIGDPSHWRMFYDVNLGMEAENLIAGGRCIAHGIPCSSGCSNGSSTTGEVIRIDDLRPLSAVLDERWKSIVPIATSAA
jgi:hypothetical protein